MGSSRARVELARDHLFVHQHRPGHIVYVSFSFQHSVSRKVLNRSPRKRCILHVGEMLSTECPPFLATTSCQELPGCENVLGEVNWRPAVVNASMLLSDGRTVKWFPQYGCALIAIGKCTVSGGPIVRRALSIVGCDNWTFTPRWISPPR